VHHQHLRLVISIDHMNLHRVFVVVVFIVIIVIFVVATVIVCITAWLLRSACITTGSSSNLLFIVVVDNYQLASDGFRCSCDCHSSVVAGRG